MRSDLPGTRSGEDEDLREKIAGLHAVVLLGSFMHASPRQEYTAELSAGGLAALARVPLAAVAWHASGPSGPLRLAGRYAGGEGIPAGLARPLVNLCSQLPVCRPTRLEGPQLPGRLRAAGVQVLFALPLRFSTQCLGFLIAGGDSAAFLQDLMLVQALGAQTSTALFVARTKESEAARARELAHLTNVLREQGDLLSRALRFQEGLIDLVLHGRDAGAIVEHLAGQLRAPVWLLDVDGRVVARSSSGSGGPSIDLPGEAELRRALRGSHDTQVAVEVNVGDGRAFLAQAVATDQETFGYLLVGSTALDRLGQTALQSGRLALSLRLLIERSIAEAEERAVSDLIQDVLLLRRGGHASSSALAARLGYERDGPAVVLAVRVRAGDRLGQRWEGARRRARSAVRDEFRGNTQGIAGVIGEETVAIVRPEAADACGRRILDRLAATVPELQIAIGISDPHDSLGDLEAAHREALMAVAMAERLSLGVLRFRDLGIHRLLFDVAHPQRVEEHVERWLGPLVRYDAAHGTQLVETLARYLTGQGNHDEIARALFIHPSTLKYRLRRIREILGFDFTLPDARFNVELALRLAQALRDIRAAGSDRAPGTPAGNGATSPGG